MKGQGHITVISTHDLNRFKRDCSDLNMVGIEINRGDVKIEWLTKFKATHLNDVLVLSEQLKQKGYTIIREKFEILPDPYQTVEYYEFHITVNQLISDDEFTLYCFCSNRQFGFSKETQQFDRVMVTGRFKNQSLNHVDQIMNDTMKYIQSMGYNIDKAILEQCVYDSDISQDNDWLPTIID